VSGWQQLQSGDAGHVADVGGHWDRYVALWIIFGVKKIPNHGACLSWCPEEFLAMQFGRVDETSFSFDASGPLSPLQVGVAFGSNRIKISWMSQQENYSAIALGCTWILLVGFLFLHRAWNVSGVCDRALSIWWSRLRSFAHLLLIQSGDSARDHGIFSWNADIHTMVSDIFLKLWHRQLPSLCNAMPDFLQRKNRFRHIATNWCKRTINSFNY